MIVKMQLMEQQKIWFHVRAVLAFGFLKGAVLPAVD